MISAWKFHQTMIMVSILVSFVMSSWAQNQTDWEDYKKEYNKTYQSEDEQDKSRGHFEKNLRDVTSHNNGNSSYTKGVNQFSDMSPEEAIKKLCTNSEGARNTSHDMNFLVSNRDLQQSVNWVTKGAVTSVKNQMGCGSCTMFAVVGAVEGANFIKHGVNRDLSIQQVVDCANTGGCGGGNNEKNFDYIIANNGLDWDSCYPYVGKDQTCAYKSDCVGAVVNSYVRITPYGDEDATANALQSIGPLAIGIYVNDNFVQYKSGIFNDPTCNQPIQHAGVLVGFGEENGQKYWIFKNSWGPEWGENGYMRLARDQNNMCQVATDVSYPILN